MDQKKKSNKAGTWIIVIMGMIAVYLIFPAFVMSILRTIGIVLAVVLALGLLAYWKLPRFRGMVQAKWQQVRHKKQKPVQSQPGHDPVIPQSRSSQDTVVRHRDNNTLSKIREVPYEDCVDWPRVSTSKMIEVLSQRGQVRG